MKIQTQNYNYAYNSKSELVNISETLQSELYYCPVCGELMTPHKGKIRRWHFVHKNVGNCSYESYLHKLAKIKIREAFLTADNFLLSYRAKSVCSYDCLFVDSPKCESEKWVKFDLRKYYDKCDLEATFGQYRADLLLSSSSNPKRPPVLIEIMVTHQCTEEKRESGVRIIEIPIQSETQIDAIINDCRLNAVRFENYHDCHLKTRPIILYNFNKLEYFDPREQCNIFLKKILLFWLNKEGYFCCYDCYCYEVKNKMPANVHYYISTITGTRYKQIFKGFSQRGVKIRNCFLCKFSKYNLDYGRLCVLYKKHNLPIKPSPYTAKSCPHYREDFSDEDFIDISDSHLMGKHFYFICKDIL